MREITAVETDNTVGVMSGCHPRSRLDFTTDGFGRAISRCPVCHVIALVPVRRDAPTPSAGRLTRATIRQKSHFRYSDEQVASILQMQADANGGVLSRSQWIRTKRAPCVGELLRRYGSWTKVQGIALAGPSPRSRMPRLCFDPPSCASI